MANIHGTEGDVTFTDLNDALGKITSWSYTQSSDTARTTGMGDAWEDYVPGLDSFTATVEAVAQTTIDHTADIGAGATLTLFLDTGGTESVAAAAICTSITETASIDDVGRISATFIGNADTVTYPS